LVLTRPAEESNLERVGLANPGEEIPLAQLDVTTRDAEAHLARFGLARPVR
jgi:hypothetical protein